MKDMWWGYNTIVCPNLLIELGGGGLNPVPMWADGRIIRCGWWFNPIIANGSQEADSPYSCWPVSWWAEPESVCQNKPSPPPSAVKPPGRLIMVLIYGWARRQWAGSKSASLFSKRPLKNDYSIPVPVQNNPRRFNVISVGPHTPAAWLKIFLHLFNQTSPAHSVQFSCRLQRRRASQSIKEIHQREEGWSWKQTHCSAVGNTFTVLLKHLLYTFSLHWRALRASSVDPFF